VYPVICREEERAADVSKDLRPRSPDRIDVLDEHSARGGAVASPQLLTVLIVRPTIVVRGKEKRAADVAQVAQHRPLVTRTDVLHEHCAFGGAVASPQLTSSDTVVRSKERCARDVREVPRV
jgi:hypothetical protein